MSYLDCRYRVEFGVEEYTAVDERARRRGIAWFASPWDLDSVAFLEAFDTPAHKIEAACLTDDELPRTLRSTGRTIVLSKRVYDGERAPMKKSRRFTGDQTEVDRNALAEVS